MRPVLVLIVCLALAGCPKRFDPQGDPDVPTSGDATARARFRQAQARFAQDEYEQSGEEFEQIAKEYPDDPIAPAAKLYGGMAAFRRGDHDAAVAALEPLVADEKQVAEDVRKRARFFLGLSYAVVGRHAEAKALLEPFVGKLAGGDDEAELYAALGEAAAGTRDAEKALHYYDEWFARGRPAERLYIGARVSALVDGLSDEAAERAYRAADKRRAAAAYLGRRLAMDARAAGNEAQARRILDETAQARANVGLPSGDGASRAGAVTDPQLVGVLLPLSGKRRLVGEQSLAGLALAAGTYGQSSGGPKPFTLAVRDSGDGAAAVGKALGDLAADGVIAVVGPVEKDASDEAARAAEAAGLPLVTLDFSDAPAAGSPHVYRIVVSLEARAKALARHAYAQGARDFAILAPDMDYGDRAAKAFRAEVERLGGQVVVTVVYAKKSTAFVDPVKKIARKPFDALFVPDKADVLELIAPQLAVENLVVGPPGATKPRRGRAIVLLSTAEAVTAKFLTGTGRYSLGAILAPGFYPDDQDKQLAAYANAFQAAYGKPPTYLDAYAWDAALVLRAAVEAGAVDRDSLAAALAGATVIGLTGEIRFDAQRQRADTGMLYTVVNGTSGAQEIRALR